MEKKSTPIGLAKTFRALASSASPAALNVLDAALREESDDVKHIALNLLLSKRNRNYAILVAKNYTLLPDDMKSLALRDTTTLLSVLSEIMQKGGEEDKISVITLVRDLRDPRGIKPIATALADESRTIREKAYAALLRIVWKVAAGNAPPQDRAQLLAALIEAFGRLNDDHDPVILGSILRIDPSHTSPILKLAASPADEQRRRVLRFLASTDLPEVHQLLVAMLKAEAGRARNAVLWTLRSRKEPAFINPFVNRLSVGDPLAIETFAKMSQNIPWCSPYNETYQELDPKVQAWLSGVQTGGPAAVVPVNQVTVSTGILSKLDINERKRMLRSVRDINRTDERAILREALCDPSEEVQRLAVEKLAETKHTDRNKLLLAQVRSQFPEVRRAVLAALGRTVFASYFRSLDRLTPELRRQAGLALAKLDPNLIAELQAELASANSERRFRALLATIATGKEKQLEQQILRQSQDEDDRIRATATGMLGRVGSPAAVKAIIAALADPDNRVKANAVSALGLLKDKKFAKIARPFLESSNSRIRTNAAVVMCQLDQSEGARVLQEMAKDPRDDFRASSAWGLGQIYDERASLLLENLAENDDMENVRNIARRMIKENSDSQKVLGNAPGS